MLLAMANRPIDSNTTFSTGGDVSRFQRRTVPGSPARRDRNAMASAGAAFGACRCRCSGAVRSSASLAAIMSPLFRWELAKMKTQAIIRRARLGTAMAALAIAPRHGRALRPRRCPAHRHQPAETLTSARAPASWSACRSR